MAPWWRGKRRREMAEGEAREAGFTQQITWDSGDGFGGRALIQPDTYTEGDFRAFCLEGGEMMLFHGWAIYVNEG